MLNKTLRGYYKRMLYQNRGPVARGLDFLALRLVFFLSFWILFGQSLHSLWQGAVMALIATLAISAAIEVAKERKLAAFIQRKRRELSQEYWLEQLVLMDGKEFSSLVVELIGSMGYTVKGRLRGALICENQGEISMVFPVQYHQSYSISPQDALDMYRMAHSKEIEDIVVVATCPMADETRTFLHKLYPTRFSVLSRATLLKAAERTGKLPSPAATENALLEALRQNEMSLQKLRMQALYSGKTKAYLFCGLVLLATTYFTGFNLYYPFVAALCFLLAFVSHYHTRTSPKG